MTFFASSITTKKNDNKYEKTWEYIIHKVKYFFICCRRSKVNGCLATVAFFVFNERGMRKYINNTCVRTLNVDLELLCSYVIHKVRVSIFRLFCVRFVCIIIIDNDKVRPPDIWLDRKNGAHCTHSQLQIYTIFLCWCFSFDFNLNSC